MSVRFVLRLEGLVMLVLAVVVYKHLGASWGLFAALFLVPDLSLLGYLANPRVGAAVYNTAHSELLPAILGVAGLVAAPALVPYALIWAAHIGFDRSLGYGLKHETSFHATHLGLIGHKA